VLGERRASKSDHGTAKFEHGGLAGFDVRKRSGDDVGVQVAVGNVAPHGYIEATAGEGIVVERQQCLEMFEGTIMSPAVFFRSVSPTPASPGRPR